MNLARTRPSLAVVLALLAAGLTACGSDGDGSSDDGGAPGDSTVDGAGDATTTDGNTDGDATVVADVVTDTADAAEATPETEVGDAGTDGDAVVDADMGSDGEIEGSVCVDGTVQSCHLIIHTNTEAGVIDCTTAKQTCLGGSWGTCGVELAFCPSPTMAQTVTFYVTPDAPAAFESTWNTMVSSTIPYGTQLFFDRLTTSPATPTVQVLQAVTAPSISLNLDPGAPVTTPVTIDPTTLVLHADSIAGNFALDIQNVSSTFIMPIAAYGFDGHLDGTCLSTDDFTITTVIPQSAGVLGFQGNLLSGLLGPTTATTPVPGWNITFTTTNPNPPKTSMPRAPR